MAIYTDEGKMRTKRMVLAALFCAMAYVQLVFRIKVFGFLTFDAKDAVLTLGAMVLGPVAGVVMAVLVAFIEMLSLSDTGFWGFFMNAVSSAVFASLASLLYRKKRSLNMALVGLAVSVLATTAVMLLMNIWVTPIYSGMPTETVVRMIPTTLLPFNLVKAIFNAALVMALYKPVTVALRQAHLLSGAADYRMNRVSILVILCSVLVIAGCVTAFVLGMNGHFEFGTK